MRDEHEHFLITSGPGLWSFQEIADLWSFQETVSRHLMEYCCQINLNNNFDYILDYKQSCFFFHEERVP